jgi:hypothetical protein
VGMKEMKTETRQRRQKKGDEREIFRKEKK